MNEAFTFISMLYHYIATHVQKVISLISDELATGIPNDTILFHPILS